jgi:hypothetical protein
MGRSSGAKWPCVFTTRTRAARRVTALHLYSGSCHSCLGLGLGLAFLISSPSLPFCISSGCGRLMRAIWGWMAPPAVTGVRRKAGMGHVRNSGGKRQVGSGPSHWASVASGSPSLVVALPCISFSFSGQGVVAHGCSSSGDGSLRERDRREGRAISLDGDRESETGRCEKSECLSSNHTRLTSS